MASIPAGEFEMGSERGAGWEKPAHRVHPAFQIGVRPVTNAEFLQSARPRRLRRPHPDAPSPT